MTKKYLITIALVVIITLVACSQKPKFPEFKHDYDDIKKVAIDIGKKAGEPSPVVNGIAKSAINGKATWVVNVEGNFVSPYEKENNINKLGITVSDQDLRVILIVGQLNDKIKWHIEYK